MTEETATPQQNEDRQPTKDELLAYLKDSLEIAKLRAELQSYNTQIAVGRAEELRAIIMIGQMTNPQPEQSSDSEEEVPEELKRGLKRKPQPVE